MHSNLIFIDFLYPIPNSYSTISDTIHICFYSKLFKKLYLFLTTHIINFYNKDINLLLDILVLFIYLLVKLNLFIY